MEELFKNLDINTKKFIEDLTANCIYLNVNLLLSSGKFVDFSENIKVGGYFSDDSGEEQPVLACATGDEVNKWLPILVHESCHLDQWIENSEFWLNADGVTLIDEWLEGNEIDNETLSKSFRQAIDLELDCEKRSVEKIKKYNLPINTEEYIQKANAYILFYNYVKKHRKWSIPGNPPYGEKIYPSAPKVWLIDYDIIPEDLEKEFDKNLGII